uniref:Uncharacterized protein n=1 Tax=Alexandrium monilatum TaxID=311494 RepID=A0A7S4RBR7_9DINO
MHARSGVNEQAHVHFGAKRTHTSRRARMRANAHVRVALLFCVFLAPPHADRRVCGGREGGGGHAHSQGDPQLSPRWRHGSGPCAAVGGACACCLRGGVSRLGISNGAPSLYGQ